MLAVGSYSRSPRENHRELKMNGHLGLIMGSTLCISSNAENRKGGKQKRITSSHLNLNFISFFLSLLSFTCLLYGVL